MKKNPINYNVPTMQISCKKCGKWYKLINRPAGSCPHCGHVPNANLLAYIVNQHIQSTDEPINSEPSKDSPSTHQTSIDHFS
jgi:rRNA maturation endonuclease Nob1